MSGAQTDRRTILRIARYLLDGHAALSAAAVQGQMLLDNGARSAICVRSTILKRMASDGLVRREASTIALSEAGEAFLKRVAGDGFTAQHRDVEQRSIALPSGQRVVDVNISESPLSQLARRKDRNGRPFLDERELRAGERLRSDYTRGQIMPRLGANWIASVSSGRRGGAGGAAELTDAALAARQRVDSALHAVGPELDGVLVDICCFLKGFELVEAERGWPVRSAKVVLKTALGTLARHYEPRSAHGKSGHRTLHWGAPDFRPTLS